MPHPRRRLGAAWIALALLPLGGCGVFECPDFGDFGPVEVDHARVEAAAPAGTDLVVALIQTDRSADVGFYVRAGVEDPAPSADAVEVRYRLDGDAYTSRTPSLAAATRGDTTFVYLEGEVDPSVFREACSPPVASLRFSIDGVAVPEGVERVSFTVVRLDQLGREVQSFLRDRDAERAAHRPLTV